MLAEMLRQHTDVFITQPKEVHFLAFANEHVQFNGPGDDVSVNRASVTEIGAYLSLYDSSLGMSARGDASVSTLYYPEQALANLNENFPNARLVVLLREPVSRAYSAYSYLRVRGFEPRQDFLDAVRQEPSRIQQNWHYLWHYTSMGRYVHQLRPFIEELGVDRLKILFYEDLTRDPDEGAREVFRFLGVDDTQGVVARHVNASGTPRSRITQAAMHWATRQPRLRDALTAVVPFKVRERIRLANLHPSEASEEARTVLGEIFREDTIALGSLLEKHYPGLPTPTWLCDAAESRTT